jgi:hypothetical protein
MQIANRLSSAASGDGLGNRAGRADGSGVSGDREGVTASAAVIGGYDPSSRVSLSAEALLFLSRTKKTTEKYPALTRDEWANTLSPQLAAREYQAFGKYSESGDYQAYYRAFMNYYDALRPEDQNSLRYFGTREAAVAGLRSLDYNDAEGLEPETGFQTLVSVLLDESKDVASGPEAVPVGMVAGDMFGWDTAGISYEDVSESRADLSEIDRLYQESF